MSADDLREAARGLLVGGFLTGDTATKARRYRRELADLFRDQFGWQVFAEDRGPVRALCLPGAGHVPRGLASRGGKPFDPQRYALLFLVLASLEAAGARTTLTVLFEEVCTRAGDIEGLMFDRNQASHRRAFVHAVQASVDLGVLELADGNEEAFATSGTGDALYRVQRAHLTRLLATSKPPSLATDAESAVVENLYTNTNDGQMRQRRHRVTRSLASEPVLYRSDLSDDEIEYITGQEARLRRVLDEQFGLTLETRAEGWIAVDTDGTMTDQRFPTISVSRAAALAIVDASRGRRDGTNEAHWPIGELNSFVGELGTTFGTSWTVGADDADGIERITDEAVDALLAMRLARRDGDDVVAMPAAGRFAITAATPDAAPMALTFDAETA